MPRVIAFLPLCLLVLCACPQKQEPKPVPEPVVEPTAKPDPVPDPAVPKVEPTPADDESACEKRVAETNRQRFSLEDESQFLRASVAAKTRGDLPSPPTLPDEPYVTAPCEDKLKYAQQLKDIFSKYRDSLRATLDASAGKGEKQGE